MCCRSSNPGRGSFPPASLKGEYLNDRMVLKADASGPWVTRTLATVWTQHLCLGVWIEDPTGIPPPMIESSRKGVSNFSSLRHKQGGKWSSQQTFLNKLLSSVCLGSWEHCCSVSESPVEGEIALPCLPELGNTLQFHTAVISHFKE